MSFALSVLNSALVNFVIKRFQWFFKMTLFSFLDNQKGKEIVLVFTEPIIQPLESFSESVRHIIAGTGLSLHQNLPSNLTSHGQIKTARHVLW